MSSEQSLEFREYLVKTQHELRTKQDQLVVTIASTALTLSVAFIHKVVSIPEADWISLLILAWVALTSSLASVLISILTGIKSYDEGIQSIDRGITGLDGKSQELWGKSSELLHVAGPTLLIIGIILNTSFVALNLLITNLP